MGAPGGRRRVIVWVAVMAILGAGCGSTATSPPASVAAPAAAVAGITAAPTPGSPAVTAAPRSAPSPAPSASAAPSAAPTVAPLPPPGRARAFGCLTLASNAQVSAATHIRVYLVDLTNLPSGVTLPKLAAGETKCTYIGFEKRGGQEVYLTVDVTVLTDGARSNFDQTWRANRGTSLVTTVSGVGDDAAWLASQDTLAGIKGATAFVITLEPTPFTMYTPAAARAAATAVARAVAAHL